MWWGFRGGEGLGVVVVWGGSMGWWDLGIVGSREWWGSWGGRELGVLGSRGGGALGVVGVKGW